MTDQAAGQRIEKPLIITNQEFLAKAASSLALSLWMTLVKNVTGLFGFSYAA